MIPCFHLEFYFIGVEKLHESENYEKPFDYMFECVLQSFKARPLFHENESVIHYHSFQQI